MGLERQTPSGIAEAVVYGCGGDSCVAVGIAGVAWLQAVVAAGYGIVERHVVSAVEHHL